MNVILAILGVLLFGFVCFIFSGGNISLGTIIMIAGLIIAVYSILKE